MDITFDDASIQEFSAEEKQQILDKHNEFRSAVSPSASNMEYMVSCLRGVNFSKKIQHGDMGNMGHKKLPDKNFDKAIPHHVIFSVICNT